MKNITKRKRDWVAWLQNYGPAKFLKVFLRNAQDAESTCRHCHQKIYLDIIEGGGVTDWRTAGGDYGCDAASSTGSHDPVRLET